MTYTKNAKSSARKLFVKLGDAETFSGNLSRHEATMLCAVALTLGGPPGVSTYTLSKMRLPFDLTRPWFRLRLLAYFLALL